MGMKPQEGEMYDMFLDKTPFPPFLLFPLWACVQNLVTSEAETEKQLIFCHRGQVFNFSSLLSLADILAVGFSEL